MSYSLIDSGGRRKLERFGPVLLDRPSLQAVWRPKNETRWKSKDAFFTRDTRGEWRGIENLPQEWEITVSGIRFLLRPTDFGHIGIFPEQRPFWHWMEKTVSRSFATRKTLKVLNLFAYSGGSTLACAKGGAEVTHLDASKKMVGWARENAALNSLADAPIRWIVDDVRKFLKREVKRGRKYDAVILDPPSFGRGVKGEVFKIEEDLLEILAGCRSLLSDNPLFLFLTCHTPGYTPTVLKHLMEETLEGQGGKIDAGEMLLEGEEGVLPLPSGSFARWEAC